jgi:NDP-sugar pyrophosphorylase family protein
VHAVILAGGEGSRLWPYTAVIPKPLMPIADDLPIMDIILRQLALHGFQRATVAIGHHGRLVRAFFGAGERWGIAVDYAEEHTPLGTMGPVLPILDDLPEHFLVMNCDVLTDLDYSDFLAQHRHSGGALTVAICNRATRIEFGVVETDGDRITGFREKPNLRHQAIMGVYALSRSALVRYAAGRPLGMDELVLDLLASTDPPRAFSWPGYWRDIGRPDDYEQACADFAHAQLGLLPEQARRPEFLPAQP